MPANNENQAPVSTALTLEQSRKRQREEELEKLFQLAPRKKGSSPSDKLVHYGRHFGRTVRTFCDFRLLIRHGITREEQMSINNVDIEELASAEQERHTVFRKLLLVCPLLEDRLFSMKRTEEDIDYVADTLSKGANGARSDDLKTMKSAVVDWITPNGGVLTPALSRNVKAGRGFHHDTTARYLCPTDYDFADENIRRQLRSGQLAVSGFQWPIFLWSGFKFNEEQLWEGFLKGKILVQAYKHVFTSPSSVDGETRSTRGGNAAIHGMTSATVPSLVYIATLVRFSLSSATTFSRTDCVTDSQRFYNSLLEFLEGEDEKQQVSELLAWWDQQVFPGHVSLGNASIPKTSALAKFTDQRRRSALRPVTAPGQTGR